MKKREVLLKNILEQIHITAEMVNDEVKIKGVESDSRQVQNGDLFVAIPGEFVDGHQFIPDALAKGAAVVVGTREIGDIGVPYIQVEDSRRALAHLAAAYYGFPAKALTVIGVTGTDGKTTTINLIYKILEKAGLRAGMISTVNAVIGEQILDTGFHVTTPDAHDVQLYLANMVEAGLTHVLLEATSHGLEQYRVEACEFNIGVVTNITHEHLDYHSSYGNYRKAKTRLFDYLSTTGTKPGVNLRAAVLNRDDSSYAYIHPRLDLRVISYGFHPDADIRAEEVTEGVGGMSFDVVIEGQKHRFSTKLIGEFNVSNCLAAVATAVYGLGIDIDDAASAIASFHTVPGRMEIIDLGQNFTAIVDFAHTPNALERSLEAARKLTDGKVIAVFGSAGLRDRAKRRMMAEISIKHADLTVLTAEDPRTESLDSILQEMADGARAAGGLEGVDFWRIPDRGDAIRYALRMARTGDLVIICGKGHEQSMCFGQTEYAWDDRTALRAALSELLNIQGPEMPYLPTQEL